MGFRPEGTWAAVGLGAELAGGLLLAVGFLTPFAATALIGQSAVIILKAHWPRGFWNRDNGYEFPLSLAAGVVAILAIGPGAISVDALVGVSWPDTLRVVLAIIGVVGGFGAIAVTRLVPTPSPAAPQPPPTPPPPDKP
jgi:putative oxidoreductase